MADLTKVQLEKWTSDELDTAVAQIVGYLGRATKHEIFEELCAISDGFPPASMEHLAGW
jgi:hypothetical protein